MWNDPKTVRADGLSGVRQIPSAVVSGYREAGGGGGGDRTAGERAGDDAAATGDAAAASQAAASRAKLVRLKVRYQPLDDIIAAERDAAAATGGGEKPAAAPAAGGTGGMNGERMGPQYAIQDGQYASGPSGSFDGGGTDRRRKTHGVVVGGGGGGWSGSGSYDADDDELDKMRVLLDAKDREISSMRTERALLEKELRDAVLSGDESGRATANEAAAEKSPSKSKSTSAAPAPATDRDRLEFLKSAASQTIVAITEASKRERDLPDGDARRADLDVVLRRADALVTKAAAVAKDAATREAADAADTEEELAKLKAAIVAAKEKDASKEEDAKRDAAAAKAKAKVSRPSLAIEMGAAGARAAEAEASASDAVVAVSPMDAEVVVDAEESDDAGGAQDDEERREMTR